MKIIRAKSSIIILCCMAVSAMQGQNIAINLSGTASSQSSAILDMSLNNNLGFLLPNVDLTNVTSINPFTSTPPDGLLVWNTNSPTNTTGGFGAGIYYWQGTQWNYASPGSSILGTLAVTSPIVNTGTPSSPILGLSSPLAVNFGGTGSVTTPANGQLLIGNGTGYTLGTLTAGAGINITNGAGTVTIANAGPTSITANVPAYITGTVTSPILNVQGGSTDNGGVLYSTGAGTSAAFNTPGTATGQILYYNSAGIPGWSTSTFPTGTIGINSLLYASATNTISPLSTGTTNQVLYSNSGVPTWGSLNTSNVITGAGTTNYLARWTSSSALGTGVIQDNGTGVSISSTALTPKNMLDVNGAVALGSYAGANTAPAGTSLIASGSVGIGNNSPNPSSILDLSNSNTTSMVGFLPPTVATPTAITTPATGLIVYNSTTGCLQAFLGTWQNISCQCSGPPPTPGAISGSTSICAFNIGIVYTIASVSGATNYIWSVPAGATFTGQGTTSITVTFGGATGGKISVSAQNTCGISASSTLQVSILAGPSAPGSISGSATPCSSSSGNIYTCASVAGATSYTWSITGAGNSISGTTTSATASFGSIVGTYTISVYASNGSCTGPSFSYTVTTLGVPSGTPTITAGCTSSGGVIVGAPETYTCASVAGATSYVWSVNNTFATVTASSTTTATITPAASAGSYTISVSASNGCFSASSSLSVTTISHGTISSFPAGSITSWTVPCGVTSIIAHVNGAQGGPASNSNVSGNGAEITATVTVVPGDVLEAAVGVVGSNGGNVWGAGAGGGSFVWDNGSSTYPLVVAGGGGGGGYSSVGQSGSITINPNNTVNEGGGAAGTGNGGAAGTASANGLGGGGGGWTGNGGGVATGDNGGGGSGAFTFIGGASNTTKGTQQGGFGGGGGGGFNSTSLWGGGGGGGGYAGGGGGNAISGSFQYGGGGGGTGYYNGAFPYTNGANFVSPASGNVNQNNNTGNGSVSITY